MKKIDENELNRALSTIQKVEASEFLLTRIQQRIRQSKEEKVSSLGAWSMGVVFILVLFLNVKVFTGNFNSYNTAKSLAETMNLIDNNTLYHRYD
jgi:hypothetical protein